MSSYAAASGNNNGLKSVLNSQNAAHASDFARQRAAEFRQNLNEGSWSLRLLALLGALAMMVLSVLGFMADFVRINWISALFGVYCFLLAIVIIILEYGQELMCFKGLEMSLFKYALFLKFVWGRGLLYFVAGTIELSQRNFLDVIVGIYMMLVGMVYICVGRSASRKMAQARRSTVTPEQMQEYFAIADEDGKGSLTVEQFGRMTQQMGMDLTRREVESSFFQLDCETGRVTYETVLQWWNNEASEKDDFQASLY